MSYFVASVNSAIQATFVEFESAAAKVEFLVSSGEPLSQRGFDVTLNVPAAARLNYETRFAKNAHVLGNVVGRGAESVGELIDRGWLLQKLIDKTPTRFIGQSL